MTNVEAWDRVATRAQGAAAPSLDVVHYGIDLPTERELRLCGDVAGKRVLELGCGDSPNAITFALQGAHAIGLDPSAAVIARGRQLAAEAEVRVEWHQTDLADLAFLRAESIDLAFSAGAVGEVEDVDRLFRQVHRVLRPNAAFVFSHPHPVALCTGRDAVGEGALPLGRLEVKRSYFEQAPATQVRHGESFTLYSRSIADIFGALGRAGFAVEVLLEPEAIRSADPGPSLPTAVVWRGRKEGL